MNAAREQSKSGHPVQINAPPIATSEGMSAAAARRIEWSIIAVCVVALIMIFQPYSLRLYGIGAALVVVGGLAFNLVPHCRPGNRLGNVVKVALIVLTLLVVVAGVAMVSAHLYGVYLGLNQ
jgi:energy-coupling factor transporter transmembrane protein EcfT